MTRLRQVARGLGSVICIGGCVFFLLPVLRNGFRLGAAFGFGVCLLGLLLLHFLERYPGWVVGGKRQSGSLRHFTV